MFHTYNWKYGFKIKIFQVNLKQQDNCQKYSLYGLLFLLAVILNHILYTIVCVIFQERHKSFLRKWMDFFFSPTLSSAHLLYHLKTRFLLQQSRLKIIKWSGTVHCCLHSLCWRGTQNCNVLITSKLWSQI